MALNPFSRPNALREFLNNQSSSGLVLMAIAALALIIANSPLGENFDALLHLHVGPLSIHHWINDGLMAVFFLLVGLEIKREMMVGELSTWSRRALPGIAAAGGMAVPAIIFLAFNGEATSNGWAIPAATDIAFALGVISLLGNRVPGSLRIFLTALAIIDDLGAVLIIAIFYTSQISFPDLAGAAGVVALLIGMNRFGLKQLWPYLFLGLFLWVFVLRSGVHATLAGVILAMTIPLGSKGGLLGEEEASPLHKMEHRLHFPVAFIVMPIFGLANAGISLIGLPASTLFSPIALGAGIGLLVGKILGVFGASMLSIKLGIAKMPSDASRFQMLGISCLCGIGFTMSLFVTMLAYPVEPVFQLEAKIGVLAGSMVSGIIGYALLKWVSGREKG